jgi:hypothetical protein
MVYTLRITDDERTTWEKEAERQGLSLAGWFKWLAKREAGVNGTQEARDASNPLKVAE